MLNLKVIWGIILHDIRAYIASYRVACEWAKKYPGIPASNFAALQDAAWADLEADLQTELREDGGVYLRSVFSIPEESKN